MLQHLPFRPQQRGNRPEEKDTQKCKRRTAGRRYIDKKRKQPVGPAGVPLPQGLGNESAAPCTKHKAHCAQNHQERHNEIDGSEGGLPHKIGNKEAVYNAVNRRKDHHHNRRQRKTQQFFIIKMVGKLNSHASIPPSPRSGTPFCFFDSGSR